MGKQRTSKRVRVKSVPAIRLSESEPQALLTGDSGVKQILQLEPGEARTAMDALGTNAVSIREDERIVTHYVARYVHLVRVVPHRQKGFSYTIRQLNRLREALSKRGLPKFRIGQIHIGRNEAGERVTETWRIHNPDGTISIKISSLNGATLNILRSQDYVREIDCNVVALPGTGTSAFCPMFKKPKSKESKSKGSAGSTNRPDMPLARFQKKWNEIAARQGYAPRMTTADCGASR